MSLIGVLALLAVVPIGMIVAVHQWKEIAYSFLTRDPNAILGGMYYTGFLSQLGLCVWAAAAGVTMFAALTLPRNSETLIARQFLFFGSLLTIMLGLDDGFMLHESFFPEIGVPEKLIFATYGLLTVGYLLRYAKLILQTNYLILAMSLGAMAFSMVIDIINIRSSDPSLYEDGAKYAGIVFWLVYFFITSMAMFKLHATPAGEPAAPPSSMAQQPTGRQN